MKKMSSKMYLELKMRGSMFKVQLLPLTIGPWTSYLTFDCYPHSQLCYHDNYSSLLHSIVVRIVQGIRTLPRMGFECLGAPHSESVFDKVELLKHLYWIECEASISDFCWGGGMWSCVWQTQGEENVSHSLNGNSVQQSALGFWRSGGNLLLSFCIHPETVHHGQRGSGGFIR